MRESSNPYLGQENSPEDSMLNVGRARWITWPPFWAFVACLGGVFVSSVLGFAYLVKKAPSCGGDDGCAVVATSAASHVLGVPIPLLGLGVYLGLAAISYRWVVKGETRFLPGAVACSAVAAILSTGLTAYAKVTLHTSCRWCLASNLLFWILTGLFASVGKGKREDLPFRSAIVHGVAVLTLLAIAAAAVDTWFNESLPFDPAAIAKAPPELLAPSGAMTFASAGPDRATVVAFVDMKCPACAKEIPLLVRSVEADRIRLLIRHFPATGHVGAMEMAEIVAEIRDPAESRKLFLAAIDRGTPSPEALLRLAAHIGIGNIPHDPFTKGKAVVANDLQIAKRLGIARTPVLVVLQPGEAPRGMMTDTFRRFLENLRNAPSKPDTR